MSRQGSERWRSYRAALACLALALAGCAAQGPRDAQAPQNSTAQDDTRPTAVSADAEPARVEVDEGVGFTVTEAVSMSGAVRSTYREALQHLAVGDHDAGVALLLEVIEAVPEATGPFVDLGIAYGRAGRHEEAVAALESAVAATPGHPVAQNELGIAYRRVGRFQEARQSYGRALEIFPGFHFARRNLAVLCDLYLADPDCALTHYEAYRAAVPDDVEVNMWLADLKNRSGVGQEEES